MTVVDRLRYVWGLSVVLSMAAVVAACGSRSPEAPVPTAAATEDFDAVAEATTADDQRRSPSAPMATGGPSSQVTAGPSEHPEKPSGDSPAAETQSGSAAPIRVAFSIYDASGVAAFVPSAPTSQDVYAEHLRRSKEEIAALVRHANATGGVHGRPIEAVPLVVKVNDRLSEASMTAICTRATEDEHASVFIDSVTMDYDSTMACFAQHNAVLVSGWSTALVDTQFLSAHWPFLAGTWSAGDRIVRAMVDGLHGARYFEDAKVGVLMDDNPNVRRVYDEVLLPALAQRGVRPVESAALAFRDPGAASSQASGAVLKFKAAGVSHVIALVSYFPWISFRDQADSQRFYPRYGFSSFRWTAWYAIAYPSPSQLKDALAVGYGGTGYGVESIVDADQARVRRSSDGGNFDINRDDPREATPGVRRCVDILSTATSRDYYRGSSSSGTWSHYCDNFLLWLDAARAAGDSADGSAWGRGLAALGTRFNATTVHSTSFVLGRGDGAASYRVGRYDEHSEVCRCYVATTPWTALE